MKNALALMAVVATVLSAEAAFAKDMTGWVVRGSGTSIVEGQTYSLYNTDQKQYLQETDRTGANLGWEASPNKAMKVKRQSGAGPLRCGENFALFVEKEWVIYGSQTVGINLTTRTQLAPDRYQWQFSNCVPGAVVKLNQPVTLKNTVANDSVVGCKRFWGVNLCWADTVFSWDGTNYHKDAIPAWVKAAAIVAGKWIFF
jgi:hypothetical protein